MIRAILTALFLRPTAARETKTPAFEPTICGVPHLRAGGMLIMTELDGARSVVSDIVPPSADDHDTWRLARILLKRRGAKALDMAAGRAFGFLDRGDQAGCAMWTRIAYAIAGLERPTANKAPDVW